MAVLVSTFSMTAFAADDAAGAIENTFSHDLVGIASGRINESLSYAGLAALAGMFSSAVSATYGLLNLLCMIAFAYCVIKMFSISSAATFF